MWNRDPETPVVDDRDQPHGEEPVEQDAGASYVGLARSRQRVHADRT
jgi:hypothetical protein